MLEILEDKVFNVLIQRVWHDYDIMPCGKNINRQNFECIQIYQL